MSKGIELIAIERKRQIEELGFDYTNDALYANEQLAIAGSCYAMPTNKRNFQSKNFYITLISMYWPWSITFWKPTPKDRIKELSKAGALIAAQIDYELNKK